MESRLILLTNDDGIESAALWAAAEALQPLGELVVAAPNRQWSGGGRSMPYSSTGTITAVSRQINGLPAVAYAVDGSPAQTVVHGLLEILKRPPALVVSGINYGANLGPDVTISGTVGAALEAGAFGIPAIAVSMETDPVGQLAGDRGGPLKVAAELTHRFARGLLGMTFPPDVDALNINIPADATPTTPVRVARLSRRRYYLPLTPAHRGGETRQAFQQIADPQEAEPDSDVWAVRVEGQICVTPLSLDLTARLDLGGFGHALGRALCRREVASPLVAAGSRR